MFMLFDLVKKFDLFGTPVHSINLGGERVFKTSLSATLSLIVMSVTLMYCLLKLEMLLMRKNASVTTNMENFSTKDEPFDATSDEYMVAFSLIATTR